LVRPWRSGTVEVSGGHLAYHRTGGDVPCLVLSHGLTDNGLCWGRFAAALESDFDIIMLDARGHGESSRPSPDLPHDPARDISEAIDNLGLTSPALLGHSVGAYATAECAGARAGGVSKVVLEDPPFLPPGGLAAAETRRERFRNQVEQFQAMSEAQITAMGKASSPDWHDDEFPAWAAAKRQVDPDAMPFYRAPWRRAIERITAPTLLVCGEPDRGGLVTRVVAVEAVEINLNIRTVQISGAGHNIRRENFADYLTAVRTFLLAP
jgi:N-formylmaleamate deformylase